MNVKKTLAATVAVVTLGVGGLGIAATAGASSAPTAVTASAAATKGKAAHPNLRRLLRRQGAKIAAGTIGIDVKDLRTELKSGKSIADVATEHKVDPQKVVDALVAGGNKAIDKVVANGKLTADRAAKLKAKLPDAAKKVVDAKRHAK